MGSSYVDHLAAVSASAATNIDPSMGQRGYDHLAALQQISEQSGFEELSLPLQIALFLGSLVFLSATFVSITSFMFQKWKHEEELKMSREDLRQEQKQDDGDPHVKARLRKLQREAARQYSLDQIPDASVVVTNPTHIAVALKYRIGTKAAPKVIAKGEGALAKRITRIAREHGVPVVERKPVARALYYLVDVGKEIPAELYAAIAEILAYVYGLRPSSSHYGV